MGKAVLKQIVVKYDQFVEGLPKSVSLVESHHCCVTELGLSEDFRVKGRYTEKREAVAKVLYSCLCGHLSYLMGTRWLRYDIG